MSKKEIYIGNILKCTDSTKNSPNQLKITTYNYLPSQEETSINFSLYRFEEQYEIYKRDATLIKLGEGIYIDKEDIKSVLDYLNILMHRNNLSKIGMKLIGTFPIGYGSLFVEKEKLKKKIVKEKRKGSFYGRRIY